MGKDVMTRILAYGDELIILLDIKLLFGETLLMQSTIFGFIKND